MNSKEVHDNKILAWDYLTEMRKARRYPELWWQEGKWICAFEDTNYPERNFSGHGASPDIAVCNAYAEWQKVKEKQI